MCIIKKLTFNVHSKKSNNHDDSDKNAMFNVSCYIQFPQFLRANFLGS